MVFTKFMLPVIAFLCCPALLHSSWHWLATYLVLSELHPIFVLMHLDDLLALLSCARNAVALASDLFYLFGHLGITRHWYKSQPDPVPCLKHLGFDIDMPGQFLLLCLHWYEKLVSRIAGMLRWT